MHSPLSREQQQLVSDHLRYADIAAKMWAKRNPWLGNHFHDVKQAARMGMIAAAQRYDPTKGATFRTYAYEWVEEYVRDCVKRCKSVVSTPRHLGFLSKRDVAVDPDRHPTGPSVAHDRLLFHAVLKRVHSITAQRPNADRNVAVWAQWFEIASEPPTFERESRPRQRRNGGQLSTPARRFGLTRERVRQIIDGINAELREWLRLNGDLGAPLQTQGEPT